MSRFTILVIGAGISGLSTALHLRHYGHKVTICEAAKELTDVGAGIQIPPNSTRLLDRLGLTEELRKYVTVPDDLTIKRCSDGEVMHVMPTNPGMEKAFGFAHWLVHRADYLGVMYKAAIQRGVTFIFNARVESVDSASGMASFQDGKVIPADLIIGADGIRSQVRTSILGSEVSFVRSTGYCCYRALVPRSTMLAEPETASLMIQNSTSAWLGPGKHIIGYPIRNGEFYNLAMTHPSVSSIDTWTEPGDPSKMIATYAEFEPVIKRVLTFIERPVLWTIAEVPELPKWSTGNGRVTLVGDACHAMTPYLAQGAATGVEDGAMLAECLRHTHSVDQMGKAMDIYESVRKTRCTKIATAAQQNGDMWHGKFDQSKQETGAVFFDPDFRKWLLGYNAVKDKSCYNI